MNSDEAKTKALSFWGKIKEAYKSNPLAKKREGEITCPKCGAKNKEIAVSCKECGTKFEYQSAKKGVILGVGLAASILMVIETWILCAATAAAGAFAEAFEDYGAAAEANEANGLCNLLWAAAVAGIVGTVASYKMKNWGWKLQSIVVAIYLVAGLSEGIGSAAGMALLMSPLAVSTWLGYKVLQEAGQYLDSLHGITSPAKESV